MIVFRTVAALTFALPCWAASAQNIAAVKAKYARQRWYKALGMAVFNHHDSNRRGPAKPADLKPYVADDPDARKGLAALAAGDFLLTANLDVTKYKGKEDDTAMGYERDAETKGGWALLVNGACRYLEPGELSKLQIARPLMVVTPADAAAAKIEPKPQKPHWSDGPRVKDKPAADIAGMYHQFHLKRRAPPKSIDDLRSVVKMDGEDYSAGLALLESGKYIFRYGVPIEDMMMEIGRTVIAYEAESALRGGLVVTGDGMVYRLTAAQFAGASLAKKRPARSAAQPAKRP